MRKRVHLEKIQNKKFIVSSIIFTIIFSILFLYVQEKTKFNFKESLFLNKENSTDNILSNYRKNKNINIENSLKFNKVSILEKEKRELEYTKLKNKIIAKSYLIVELEDKKSEPNISQKIQTRILISEKENTKLPLASISKLMTAYTALNFCNDNLKLELDKILIASDNESADYVANNCPNYAEFIKNMNYLAKKNELDMTFINPSGLDINDETEASNYGSAIAIAKLINLIYIKNPEILSHTTKLSYVGIKNTNEKVRSIPFLIGSKTGFTDMAGGNLVTMYETGPNSKFVIVVLGSTKEGRFADTEILFNYYLENK